MSEEKVDKIRSKIRKIESIGTPTPIRRQNKKPVPKSREYGSYQHFQSECMKPVDEPNQILLVE